MKRLPGHPGRLVSWFRNLLAGVRLSGRQRDWPVGGVAGRQRDWPSCWGGCWAIKRLACWGGCWGHAAKQSPVPCFLFLSIPSPHLTYTHTHTRMFSVRWMQHLGCGPPRWFPQGHLMRPTCLPALPTGWQTTTTAAEICVVEYSHQQWSAATSSWPMPLRRLQGKSRSDSVFNSREILILEEYV